MTYLVFDLPAVVRQASLADVRDIMPRHSPYSIRLSHAEKYALETQARQYTAPYYSVLRAKIVLLAAQGRPNDEIAASLSVPRQLVSKWRKRFFEKGAAGLEDEPRPGRPATVAPRADRSSNAPAGEGASRHHPRPLPVQPPGFKPIPKRPAARS